MQSEETPICFSRLVTDSDSGIELVALRGVVARIREALPALVTPAQKVHLGNALLTLGVCHLVRASGSRRASTALRLAFDTLWELDPELTEAGLVAAPPSN
jgi:hypothetical protein